MIGYVSKEDSYLAASTDNIDSIKRYDGTKLYIYDTKETKISANGQWYDYKLPVIGGGGGSGVIENGSIVTEMFAENAKAPLAGVADSVASAGISDASAIGKLVLKATDAAAARTAIGAGTSNIAIGTTASTAKAGNYTPPNASTSVAGIIKQAVAQANSEATTIEGLLADFNTLVANLRTSGVVAT